MGADGAAEVVLPGPAGLRPTVSRAPSRPGRGRRGWAALALFVLGCVVSGLCLLVVVGAWRNDRQIGRHEGHAVADVLSVSFSRTAVRFVTPDGTVVIPSAGVLYPSGLAAGERVRVDYDTQHTELVRVAGRDFTLSFLPAGLSLVVCWAIVGPLVWFLRREPRVTPGRPSTT